MKCVICDANWPESFFKKLDGSTSLGCSKCIKSPFTTNTDKLLMCTDNNRQNINEFCVGQLEQNHKVDNELDRLADVQENLQNQIDELKDKNVRECVVKSHKEKEINDRPLSEKTDQELEAIINGIHNPFSIPSMQSLSKASYELCCRYREKLKNEQQKIKSQEFQLEVGKTYCNKDKSIIGIVKAIHYSICGTPRAKIYFIKHFEEEKYALRCLDGTVSYSEKSHYDLTELYVPELKLEVGNFYLNQIEHLYFVYFKNEQNKYFARSIYSVDNSACNESGKCLYDKEHYLVKKVPFNKLSWVLNKINNNEKIDLYMLEE